MRGPRCKFMLCSEVAGWVRSAAHTLVLLAVLSCAGIPSLAPAANLTLAWDASTDPTVTGYHLYYGGMTGNYTNMVDAASATSVTVSNLLPGVTYYFAATSYNLAGLESGYSAELGYTVPANVPPTLDPISDVTVQENSGLVAVNLTGITSGSGSQTQPLVVSAFSSNTGLLPNPTVNYTSPNSTGTLLLNPTTNSFGVAVVTVMVDNGGTVSNTIIRTFGFTVNATVQAPAPLTNTIITPGSYFKFVLTAPFTNHDKFAFSLASGSPAGASIVTAKKGGTSLVWVPSDAQASSTNLITIVITDTSNPALSTNETVLVIVSDFLGLGAGSASVQAGQSASIPIYLNSSDGVTNATFTVGWPGSRFPNPSLRIAGSGVGSTSLENQVSNLVITVSAQAGQVLQGSNVLVNLNFQTITNQPSAFVKLPVTISSAQKPNGEAYVDLFPQAGSVTVVNNAPLLQINSISGASLSMTIYAKTGAKCQLQSATNTVEPLTWQALLTYTQTNVAQTFNLNAPGASSVYRLLQQ